MPKFNANLSYLFTEVDFLDRFAAAAKAGFEAVEILYPYDWPADEMAARLADNGLQQVLFNFPAGDESDHGGRGCGALPGFEDRWRSELDQALALARTLDCTRLHVLCGIVPDGVAWETCRDVLLENLRHGSGAAAADGISLLLEPLNTGQAPGYLLNNTTDARAIIETLDVPNVRLQFDAYHTQIMEGNLAERLRSLLPLIDHIQIAGVPGRHEPDVGEINYPFLFSEMDAIGYDGGVGLEYAPVGATEAGFSWLAAARAATSSM